MDRERERDLVLRACKGDEDAFRLLVEDNMRRVYTLALRYRNSHEDADEIAQETFIRAHKALDRFRAESRFCTWVYRIAVNCCLSHRRKAGRLAGAERIDNADSRLPDNRNPSPLRRAISSQTRQKIDAALGNLSPRQRMVFVMKYLQQQTIAEIADHLGCAEGTVKKQLFRAVNRMRQLLAPLLDLKGGSRQ